MAKGKPLTVSFYIGGKQIEKLTEEQSERMAKAVGEAMSLYYTAHPDEFEVLMKDP